MTTNPAPQKTSIVAWRCTTRPTAKASKAHSHATPSASGRFVKKDQRTETGLAERRAARAAAKQPSPTLDSRATTGIRYLRVGLRAGALRSNHGLWSPGARARLDDGGRHPRHGLAGRLAVLLGVADGSQVEGPAVSVVDDRALRSGVAAARTAHRQVGEREADPGRDVRARSSTVLLDDEPAPQLTLALSVGVRGPDLLEALRRDPRGTGPRDGAHRSVA